MKSLSINDTVMHGDQNSTHSKPFAPTTLQIQKIEPFKKQQQQQQLQHHQPHSPQQQQQQQQYQQQHTLANQTSNSMTLNQISSGLNETDQGSGSGSAEVSKYLISPTNVSNTKTSLLGWKKWKKGQTWRYNSSSNVSESENTNDTTYTNDSRPNSQNSSFAINKSTDSDTLSVNSENSYFKCGKDECQSESAGQNGGLKVSTPNPILIQTNVPHFSNSFDSTKTSYITIPQPSLNNWSSTSKLDDSSISGIFFVFQYF